MDPPHDHPNLRGGAPCEGVQSDEPIQLTGSILAQNLICAPVALVAGAAAPTRALFCLLLD
jgi:hypothetical protein